MNLSQYDDQYVRVTDKWSNIFEGISLQFPAGFGLHEFDRDEESFNVAGYQIFESDIDSIECVDPHGSAEIATENLFLRKYRPEDSEDLYEAFGKDPEMYRYSGWNPYATLEMAEETVRSSSRTIMIRIFMAESSNGIAIWPERSVPMTIKMTLLKSISVLRETTGEMAMPVKLCSLYWITCLIMKA